MKLIKTLPILLVLSLVTSTLTAQMTSSADSDPEAQRILDKLKKNYESYKSMEVDFNLVLELPGQPKEEQVGKVIQAGEKFIAKIDDQHIYCDGKSVWLHLVDNDELQINDYDELASGDMMSPKDLLRLYEDGEFVSVITGEERLNGKLVSVIEFKPLDRDSEYSKLRLYVEKKASQAHRMMVFSKDGSRYSLDIKSMKSNQSYDDSVFTFDASKYPDIYVEDLRID